MLIVVISFVYKIITQHYVFYFYWFVSGTRDSGIGKFPTRYEKLMLNFLIDPSGIPAPYSSFRVRRIGPKLKFGII